MKAQWHWVPNLPNSPCPPPLYIVHRGWVRMQIVIGAPFLAAILSLFSERIREFLAKGLGRRPKAIFLAPALLSAFFCLILAAYGALHLPLVLLILAYTFIPSACIFHLGPCRGRAGWMDLAVVLMLWLPQEFTIGSRWIPKSIQGTVHIAAYGTAITLALVLFLVFRGLQGMKCNLPRNARDLVYPALGFVIAAPVLILIGRAVGFLPPFHVPARVVSWTTVVRFLTILAATALPEEILFRALIQNCLMQKFGSTNRALLAAAVVFGSSHLNNGPGPLPNWRYMLVATVAGIAFGKVFQKSSSVVSSAGLHALVNTVDHLFF